MIASQQRPLFPLEDMPLQAEQTGDTSSTFVDNMRLPVHRWFRYSAGFSATWANEIIATERRCGETRVLDPFAGSGTTLLCAEDNGVESYGIEAHPFIYRVAQTKLLRHAAPTLYADTIRDIVAQAHELAPAIEHYPALIRKCYSDGVLLELDQLRQAVALGQDGSPVAHLSWLTLVSILRKASHVGTAQWQYVLPKKTKRRTVAPFSAFIDAAEQFRADLQLSSALIGPSARCLPGDARTCHGVPDGFATLVVTSPPYANNYDYADATRLEMTFLREIDGWGDLQQAVRQYLVRSCSQHVPERMVNLAVVLGDPVLAPIREELEAVCAMLAEVRLTKGGRKTYHLMVASYFQDLANVWHSLRRVCASPSKVCFVIGDVAPYGVYVPVMEWLGKLALAAGFEAWHFERTRDRNVKWKNRKHTVPLCEGQLWVRG